VVVDRFRIPKASPTTNGDSRIAQGIEAAWRAGGGTAVLHFVDDETELELREGLSCPVCARELRHAAPGLFSYDSPVGACPKCRGFGRIIGIDLGKVIPDPYKTLSQRVIRPWSGPSTAWERKELGRLCARHGIAMDVPWKELPDGDRNLVLEGDGPVLQADDHKTPAPDISGDRIDDGERKTGRDGGVYGIAPFF
jgi:excinuclease ABC subunit A